MTSSGLLMPPDQKASQTRSILLFSSPVITGATLVTYDCDVANGRRPARPARGPSQICPWPGHLSSFALPKGTRGGHAPENHMPLPRFFGRSGAIFAWGRYCV